MITCHVLYPVSWISHPSPSRHRHLLLRLPYFSRKKTKRREEKALCIQGEKKSPELDENWIKNQWYVQRTSELSLMMHDACPHLTRARSAIITLNMNFVLFITVLIINTWGRWCIHTCEVAMWHLGRAYVRKQGSLKCSTTHTCNASVREKKEWSAFNKRCVRSPPMHGERGQHSLYVRRW